MPENRALAYSSMGLLDFQKRFSSESECYAYLVRTRFPGGFACPRCGSMDAGTIQTRGLWQCKGCRTQVSVTAGTMFHRTRTPLHHWFWAVFLVAQDKRGHSALQRSKELGIPYDRAWLMMHKIRSAMACRDARYRLAGIIEMDEAYCGAPDPGRRGRSTRRTKALVAVSLTESGKPRCAKLQTIRRLDGRGIARFALGAFAPGSTVRTDGLRAYGRLPHPGFRHDPVVASASDSQNLLHGVHIVISHAKAFLTGTFHGLDDKHIQRYLDEFCYRFNRRHRQAELFDRLRLACATAPPLTYDELTR